MKLAWARDYRREHRVGVIAVEDLALGPHHHDDPNGERNQNQSQNPCIEHRDRHIESSLVSDGLLSRRSGGVGYDTTINASAMIAPSPRGPTITGIEVD